MTKKEIYKRMDRISEKIDDLSDQMRDLEDERDELIELLNDYNEEAEAEDRKYDEFEERRKASKYD